MSLPPLKYWVMRTLRRHTPQRVVEWLLDRSICLHPGRDTLHPDESLAALLDGAKQHGLAIERARACIVGFGGSFGLGLALLERGAEQVILQDPFAPERTWRNNRRVDPALLEKYMIADDGRWIPRDDRVVVVRDPLAVLAARQPASVDLVFSNSVLEHVADVDDVVGASARLLRPTGLALHFVDLRDHYFQYPFEMLCYEDATWRRWLNASNHLNRLRRRDYAAIFARHFAEVKIEPTSRLEREFAATRGRIRPEFLSGDAAEDSIAQIRVEARQPRHE